MTLVQNVVGKGIGEGLAVGVNHGDWCKLVCMGKRKMASGQNKGK